MAEDRVLSALELDPIGLSHLNPIAAHLEGDRAATQVFAAGAMIQDTVVQVGNLIGGLPDAPPYSFLAQQVFADMAEKTAGSGARLNLTLPPVIEFPSRQTP